MDRDRLDVRRALIIAPFVLIGAAILACAWPPNRGEAPAFAEGPLTPRIEAPERALTFAALRDGGGTPAIVLVVGWSGSSVRIIDLGDASTPPPADPFEAIDRFGAERLTHLATADGPGARSIPVTGLAPTGTGTWQVATGTNFREHASEVAIDRPFLFPKFGAATPAETSVERTSGALLDYEVEICVRFDRPLRTLADFDAARKAFFLCGDFTDRAALMRLLPDEPAPSGIGFSDAKSGPGFFPTGPFLVVPQDWRRFVAEERIATRVDGRLRQDAFGRDMTLDFRALAERVLAEGPAPRWRYRGEPVALFAGDGLARGAALMSGTPAGVIFRPPGPREIACGVLAFVCLFGFLDATSLRGYVVERYVRRLLADGRFLQPGAVVQHDSSRMGAIRVEVR